MFVPHGPCTGLNFYDSASELTAGEYLGVNASISDIQLLLKVRSLPRASDLRRVFITGGTGYLGSNLIPALLERGHRVRVLVRPHSKGKVTAGCEVVSGDPLHANSYRNLIRPADTFIHLVGVPHPSPSKGEQFRLVDLVAAREAIQVASELGMQHFIYLSVAQPAPIWKAYVAVRAECEQMIHQVHLNSTILRPWYVLGPGHRWPYVLLPLYKLMELLPFTRSGAQRLGLVRLEQMVLAMVAAVEAPAFGVRIVEVPGIRAAHLGAGRDVPGKST
jgi:nucleoside-diphosphate-sugar epimerase